MTTFHPSPFPSGNYMYHPLYKLCILLTSCTNVIRMILRANVVYLPAQHELTGLHNGQGLCSLCGRNWFLCTVYVNTTMMAVPSPRQLIVSLSLRRPIFYSRLFNPTFVMDKVALGQVFLPVPGFSAIGIIPLKFHTYLHIHVGLTRRTHRLRFYILLTVHHIMILSKWPTWCTNSFPCIYFYL